MKKIFYLVFVAALMLSMTACGQNKNSVPQQGAEPQPTAVEIEPTATPQPTEVPREYYSSGKSSHTNEMVLRNKTDKKLLITSAKVIYRKDGAEVKTLDYNNANGLSNLRLAGVSLEPGEEHEVHDTYSSTKLWDECEYIIIGTDEDGETQTYRFAFKNKDIMVPKNTDKDLQRLRHDVDFELEVSPGLYWVPAVSLGESRYTNEEILQMTSLSPQEKQEKISTLYEALQLFQLGNFGTQDVDVRIDEGYISWEHHKPGYYAVLANQGACATSSDWLKYILEDDYDEIGFVQITEPDGSGHVINYIYHDGWYYFVDFTHYNMTYIADSAVEDGTLASYRDSDIVLGNIHKAKSAEPYVRHTLNNANQPPVLMYMYNAPEAIALGMNWNVPYETHFPDMSTVTKHSVILDNTAGHIVVDYTLSPTVFPDWSQLP